MSPVFAPLLYEVAGAIGKLTLNRPEKRNALDADLVGSLTAALRAMDGDEAVRVITLRAAGSDFSAGADLAALGRIADAGVLENLADVDGLAELFLTIRRLSKPVVAVVRGRAIAGGCGLATACDLVYAAESASFGYTEIDIGFVPAMVMAILRRNVPEKKSFELIVSGSRITAAEAERIGIVNRVFPDDRLEEEVGLVVEDLAGRSASAVLLCKRLLYLQDGMSFEAAIRAGADVNVLARMTEDTRAGIAAFLDRSGHGPSQNPGS
jgi:methylglutaconyl-CoA hydratase